MSNLRVVDCSHSGLLFSFEAFVSVMFKTKTRPDTGREFDSRGSTRFTLFSGQVVLSVFLQRTYRDHGCRVSLKPLTELPVRLTCQRRSVSCSRVVFSDFPRKRLS